jgi:AbrB family looped-hinge helix DNA binding protein
LHYNIIVLDDIKKGKVIINMTTGAIRITKKGQVTIPKNIREKLNANTIYFDVVDDVVTVKAVKDVAGSLNRYAKNVTPGTSMKQIKEKAWEVATHEKAGEKPA